MTLAFFRADFFPNDQSSIVKSLCWPRQILGQRILCHSLKKSRRGQSRRNTSVIRNKNYRVNMKLFFLSFIIFITSPRDLVSQCGSAKFSIVSSSNWRSVRSRRRYYYGVQRNLLNYTDSASEVRLAPHPFSPFAPLPSIPLSISTSWSRMLYISFILAHSGQMMSSPSVMKPRPTSEVLQPAQMKQSLCQCLSSNEMKRVPPIPAN